MLLEKNPVALKATKDAVRRVEEMTYDNAEDYLIRAQEAANCFDNEGRKEGIRQFIDEKSYKPGLGAYDLKQAAAEADADSMPSDDQRPPRARRSTACSVRVRSRSSAHRRPRARWARACSPISSAHGFAGDIHLINPKRDEIGGRPCLKSLDDLPYGVDVGGARHPGRCGARPSAQLAARERRRGGDLLRGLRRRRRGGARRAAGDRAASPTSTASSSKGPNCLGMINYVDGIPLTFVDRPRASGWVIGRASASSRRSGAMAAVLGVTLMARELGISISVSTGNEAASGRRGLCRISDRRSRHPRDRA